MKRTYIIFLLLLMLSGMQVLGQNYKVTTSEVVYKEIDGYKLEMTIYKPDINSNLKLPAIVFFFGGGWTSGTPTHFEMQARYLASRGMIAFCPDYRVKNRQGTSPFESVKDARSAMRYVKKHANELGVNVDKIVASGGSAGGHLAACTAIIKNINEESDDLSISPVPFALVLFNPVIDTSKKGYGQEKLSGREFELSPVHHVEAGVPQTLIMHGKKDTTVPFKNALNFKSIMKQEGNVCKLKAYKNQKHGFFNHSRSPKCFRKTLAETERFLDKLELFKGESWVKKYCKEL